MTFTGCTLDKNSEGPVYEKYDIVEVDDNESDARVTLEDDDKPAENKRAPETEK